MNAPQTKQRLKEFGEWLKLRRVAGELTPLDIAKFLGIDIQDYKRIEAGEQGITDEMLVALAKLEKLKITVEVLRKKAVIVSATDAAKPVPVQAPPPRKTSSPLDAILASATAAQQRAQARVERPRSPLGTFLEAQREEKGWSRMDLARACKVMPDLLDDIDAGFVPGQAVLRKMAEGLDLSLEQIEQATVG